MPIRASQRALYPANWREISQQARERARNRCEDCDVPNHAVGYRDQNRVFHALCGSGPCDAAGEGRAWPSMEPLLYREAKGFADASNTETDGDIHGHWWFVIVLTVAHLDHDPRNCELSNLKALCQKCHLGYDAQHHAQTAYETRREGKASADLFSDGAEASP
jgi:hypothetical protein